ncbi:citrate synthase family protein [Burkholderia sp. L27(2015)]|uniref:citrate synthase family protein n=1 Tax=Burkholderia sp. L27(2015) TaxID=1641858 RepID=UPI0020B14D0F|nr:citrate synthase family protein [Burkholderia sp. L27(2015)]
MQINVKSWITQEEACDALGVRKQTLYAYVSRGQIEVRWDPQHVNRKLYRESDISALLKKRSLGRARKSIAASTMAWGEPIISTSISTIVRGRLYYRGKDAIELSTHATIEEVARLLWDSVELPYFPAFEPLSGVGPARTRVYATMGIAAVEGEAACPPDVGSMWAEAARLIGRLASSFVELPATREPLHMRIACAWKCEQHADLLRQALVLLADQELTSSTFAARIAASTGSSLGACALAGLAALSGRLHGDATVQVQALLDETRRLGTEHGVQAWLARGAVLPGFGHELYPQGDPRATALFAAFEPSEDIRALIAYVDRSTGLKPSIDVALVALAEHCQLPEGAAFSLFAVGRCVGWMAHCIEQSISGSLLRPRAHYIGPEVLD